ncbi:pancreatic lipase-related protein 2-like [Ptychodera flava]|uniref:pancreatic lipase-related protein 2-like n=1 Tax=Ptychodera flava TaxID=63121 RepID=UPI00396A1CEC
MKLTRIWSRCYLQTDYIIMKFFILSLLFVGTLLNTGEAANVCYGDLGCFTNNPPYDNTNFLPEDPSVVNVGFALYTRSNPTVYQEISRHDPLSLAISNFDKDADTKFLIHGWTSNAGTGWVNTMRDEFMASSESLNVIAVNWQDGATGPNYGQGVANTQIVGAEVDAFIKFLEAELGSYSHDKVHLIGHSLGAQSSGHAGERMPTIGRISGLDPAGPAFEGEHPVVRIDPTDAKFVDILHTDGNSTLVGLGMYQECGDVDFYPNGGEDQPGCLLGTCDHGRCHEYYSESINSACTFRSYPCTLGNWEGCNSCNVATDCNYMGYHALSNRHGTYFLETNRNSPYCKV